MGHLVARGLNRRAGGGHDQGLTGELVEEHQINDQREEALTQRDLVSKYSHSSFDPYAAGASGKKRCHIG